MEKKIRFGICSIKRNSDGESWYHHFLSSIKILPLNTFHVEIFFLSWNIIWTHDTSFLTGLNNTRKNTTKSIETTFIRCRDHFRDVHHQWRRGITSFNTQKCFIILWTYNEQNSNRSFSPRPSFTFIE